MSIVKFSNEENPELTTWSEEDLAPADIEPPVKPEERPYAYEDSPLPDDKRPY